MSIPPNNFPPNNFPPNNFPPNNFPPNNFPPEMPPGGYYSAPPPRPSGVSGWKIAGFGCLGLFLLAAIGGFLFVRSVQNNMSHPSKNNFVGIGVTIGNAEDDGEKLSEAIAVYHTQHGKYPQTLADLVAAGNIDKKLLHNDLDDNSDPVHPSWTYTPPPEGAPGSTPILTERYDIMPNSHEGDGKVTVNLNGKSHED